MKKLTVDERLQKRIKTLNPVQKERLCELALLLRHDRNIVSVPLSMRPLMANTTGVYDLNGN